MKRFLSLLLSTALLLSCFALTVSAEEPDAPETNGVPPVLTGKDVPLFIFGDDSNVTVPLYFLDGVNDLPFADLTSFTSLLNTLFDPQNQPYSGEFDETMQSFTIRYVPSDSMLIFDFEECTAVYSSFDTFGKRPATAMIDVLSASGVNEQTGEPELFLRVNAPGLDRAPTLQTIPLDEYMIPMLVLDGHYLIPFHTVFDLAVHLPIVPLDCYYNGEAIHMGSAETFFENATDPETGAQVRQLTAAGRALYGVAPSTRSHQLATVGFGELCMELDYFYGLKDAHNIRSFSWLMLNSGYYERLTDPDPAVADAALCDFISSYLDDLHSNFQAKSFMTGYDTPLDAKAEGFSSASDEITMKRYDAARSRAFPDGVPFYQEVGNTAYITFDRFFLARGVDYYNLNLDDENCVQDTISMILYANHQIRREGSPVENVVLDMSLNGGGQADAAIFVIGWFLGRAAITSVNTFSDAQATALYFVDTNLDRDFTAEDCLAGEYNLYCLISPESFSCGNLVPWVLKASGLATLIGDTSGGGSCVVLPMTTAWGAGYTLSGNRRLSFIKNGSCYDIDRGIEPDVVLTRLSSFYNRTLLTDIINGLY